MNDERERELLGLIERYWRIVGRSTERVWQADRVMVIVATGSNSGTSFESRCTASWAESEACLREVAGEIAARGITLVWRLSGMTRDLIPVVNGHESGDLPRPVALLKAFVAAFGEKP